MRCFIIAIVDGVNHKSYKRLMKSGKLPFIEEISKNGIVVDKCCTVFPSATICGHASINTAVHPGYHGLVGQAWGST